MENDAKAMASITQDSTPYIRVGGTISLESSKSIVLLKLSVSLSRTILEDMT